MSKTIVSIKVFQLAVAARDYAPDGAPYATQAEAETAKVEMARERLESRWENADDLIDTLESVGLLDEVENAAEVDSIDDLSDAIVVRLAEQYIDFEAAIYPSSLDMVIEDVEAAIVKSGVVTEDRDDLAEGLAAAFHTYTSWEKGDLAGAVYGLQGWYEGVIERLPDLACAEDDDEDEDEGDAFVLRIEGVSDVTYDTAEEAQAAGVASGQEFEVVPRNEPEEADEGDTKGWEVGDRCDVPEAGDRGEIISFMSTPAENGFAIAVIKLDFGGENNAIVNVDKLDILYDEPDAARPY